MRRRNRGAGGSKGRTSWTARPETDDYISFIGLLVYFMHYISLPELLYSEFPPSWDDDEPYSLSPIPSQALPPLQSPMSPRSRKRPMSTSTPISQSQPLLLLAGYSYGALITAQLPALSSIISLFHAPAQGTAASEIILRAKQLAKQENDAFICMADVLKERSANNISNSTPKHSRGRSLQVETALSSRKPSATASIRLGGEETDPDLRRASQESHNRRSLSFEPERLRKSIDRVRSLVRRPDFRKSNTSLQRKGSDLSRHTSSEGSSPSTEIISPLEAAMNKVEHFGGGKDDVGLDNIKVSYLLISPLQGLVTKLATMWSRASRPQTKDSFSKISEAHSDMEKKLIENDTLAIFGDEDIFSTSKKLRLWADRLGGEQNSRFRHVEIRGAGHFWHEQGDRMWATVREFVSGL
jgi:alpha/beta superfamily hydrolase